MMEVGILRHLAYLQKEGDKTMLTCKVLTIEPVTKNSVSGKHGRIKGFLNNHHNQLNPSFVMARGVRSSWEVLARNWSLS